MLYSCSVLLSTLLLLFATAATGQTTDTTMSELRYLALGDSYTIGEAVPGDQNWPHQLSRRLREAGQPVADPEIIAVTGWTTHELQ